MHPISLQTLDHPLLKKQESVHRPTNPFNCLDHPYLFRSPPDPTSRDDLPADEEAVYIPSDGKKRLEAVMAEIDLRPASERSEPADGSIPPRPASSSPPHPSISLDAPPLASDRACMKWLGRWIQS